jgi:anti-sigma-K factor RskA
MRRYPPALQQALAAEYVLGTLRGAARLRFEELARGDEALRRAIGQWENFMLPLASTLPETEPPARVWRAIEARLGPRPAEAPEPSLWSSLAFWRFAGAGLAVVVLALLFQLASVKPPPAPTLVSVLSAQDQVARILVERRDGMLRVRMVKPWRTLGGQDLELWVVPKEGAPRSLGVVPYDRDSEIRRADLEAVLSEGISFAISREPAGGSPTGQPTGPVLCTGSIARGKT